MAARRGVGWRRLRGGAPVEPPDASTPSPLIFGFSRCLFQACNLPPSAARTGKRSCLRGVHVRSSACRCCCCCCCCCSCSCGLELLDLHVCLRSTEKLPFMCLHLRRQQQPLERPSQPHSTCHPQGSASGLRGSGSRGMLKVTRLTAFCSCVHFGENRLIESGLGQTSALEHSSECQGQPP